MFVSRFLLGFSLFAVSACGAAFKTNDMPLDTAKNEHGYAVYILATDNTGKTLSLFNEVCASGSETPIKCSEYVNAYADDEKTIRGTLIMGKTSDKDFRVTSVKLSPSMFDTVHTGSSRTRDITLMLEGLETPLHVSGTDSDNYHYFTAAFEQEGKSVRIKPVAQCARVDAVYFGMFEFHIKESNMPLPEIEFKSRLSALHMKQMALMKMRAGESFNCYALPKHLPKARIRSTRS